ncbi:DDE-type integrase/transposase/recombinase [Dehalogenimonas etheniformans]|uniref:DDE domain-containing protein n=1 Tax=Dehalogenimonas etheniformans TaxID=1536648 RepID=A0A2P5PA11_9CHLR|nr:DDE-type integrase/transposase/recombinase [Dehalogenimonas etheniformans]PPD59131.1 DDE domain-containing protein [Dehalogenimonas etheniformans]QNT75826.1 DDE-type integrase/transposase/recombinase [Dehalogenimonas etheniformans]
MKTVIVNIAKASVRVMEIVNEARISKIEYVACKWCGSQDVKKNGHKREIQQWLCAKCGRTFQNNACLPHDKYTPEDIASAVYQYYTGSSLADIRGEIKQKTGREPSDPAILQWIKKATEAALDSTRNDKPNIGDTVAADETVIKVSGKKYWCVVVVDPISKYVLSAYLSRARTARAIQLAFEQAKLKMTKPPKVVISDGYTAYPEMVKMVFGDTTHHIVTKPFEGKNGQSNNVIERFNSTLKEKHKVSRNFKSLATAKMNLLGYVYFYNYLRGHESLDGQTPAAICGLKTPNENWKEVIYSRKPLIQSTIQPVNMGYRKRQSAKVRARKPIATGAMTIRGRR